MYIVLCSINDQLYCSFLKLSKAYKLDKFHVFYGNIHVCVDYQINVIRFTVGALLLAGNWSPFVEHVLLYLQPSRAILGSQICMHLLSHCHKCVFSHRGGRRGHFVLQDNGHGPFCVRTNQCKDEPVSSEDGHEMPWVQLMLICAQPWRRRRWSKWGCSSSSESDARSHNFSPSPWKHVKPKRWNRWKDYSLLISCCPSLI